MARKEAPKSLRDSAQEIKEILTDLADGNAKFLASKFAVELASLKIEGFSARQIATALKAKGFSVTESDVKKAYIIVDAKTTYPDPVKK